LNTGVERRGVAAREARGARWYTALLTVACVGAGGAANDVRGRDAGKELHFLKIRGHSEL
jgi:hypothetical protein